MLDNVQQLNRYKETGVNILCSNYSIPYTASSPYDQALNVYIQYIQNINFDPCCYERDSFYLHVIINN